MKNIPGLFIKCALLLFGIVLGLGFLEITLRIVRPGIKGTTFDSFNDLRKAMMSGPDESGSGEDAFDPEKAPQGTVSLRAIVQPDPSDRIIYTLKPNLNLRFIRAKVETNSCGMRSPERPILKPENTFRIALLGDSFAFGWGVEQKDSFAQILEDRLNQASRGKKFEVLNFAVPGYSTFQEVALFKERAIDFDPDAVLVYFVQNDFGMPFFIRDIDGSSSILSSFEFVQMGKRLLQPKEMDKKIQALGLDPNKAIRDLNAMGQELGIPVYLALNPHKAWKSDLKRLWALSQESTVKFIPLRDNLMRLIGEKGIKEEDLTLSFDPHPSPIRHKMLGELLAVHLYELLS